jgi:protein TonB
VSRVATANDRLTFTLFLSAIFTGIVILGVGFVPPKPNNKPSLSVTIVASHSENNDEADFLANLDQQGSGAAEEIEELTSPYEAPLDAAIVQEVTMQVLSEKKKVVETPRILTTISNSQPVSDAPEEAETKPEVEQAQEEFINPTEESADVVSLQAEYAAMIQRYAKRPKIRSISTLSTKSADDAEYLQYFKETVDKTGTRNFPAQALMSNQFGEVGLKVEILSNGTLQSVDVVQSSGYAFLDEAARRSVELAAPFLPFTKEMREEVDILEIFATLEYGKQRRVSTNLGQGSKAN